MADFPRKTKTKKLKVDLNWKSDNHHDYTCSRARKDGYDLEVTHERGRVTYHWKLSKDGRTLEEGGVRGSLYGAKALAKAALEKRLK